jgi:hypothetical protein
MFTLHKAIAILLAMIAQQADMVKNFKPLGELTGTDTAIDEPFSAMVVDERSFSRIWSGHKLIFNNPPRLAGVREPEVEMPVIDFKKNVVIVFFAGQTAGVGSYRIIHLDAKGKTAIIRIAPVPHPAGGIVDNSYGMWVFPRPTKPIELEYVANARQTTPQKVAKFDPPKPTKAGS